MSVESIDPSSIMNAIKTANKYSLSFFKIASGNLAVFDRKSLVPK